MNWGLLISTMYEISLDLKVFLLIFAVSLLVLEILILPFIINVCSCCCRVREVVDIEVVVVQPCDCEVV